MSPNAELLSPTAALQDSYRSLVSEVLRLEEDLVPFVLKFDHHDFDAMLARLAECSRGIGLPTGFVPHSTFWLVRDGIEVVGVSNIRHSLNPMLRREGGNIGYGIRPSARRQGFGVEILRQSLRRAADIGIANALVTCGKANVGSVPVIGGVLESEEYLPDRGEIVQRYRLGEDPA
ncbi:MAG: GNAT family N-acetyltransferase [Betaproteobacteria bacterium]